MLGYELQISTVTQMPTAGHCEQSNVCLVVQKTRNLYFFFAINHVVTRIFEAKQHKPEVCGFVSRWCHWKFSLS